MNLAELVDRATPEQVLVVGSLPPAGRDLDLLVRSPAERALVRKLTAAGFHMHNHMWACLTDCGAQVVELIPTCDYDLDPEQLDLLFAEAKPIDGLNWLLRPAAHHSLLLMARRVAREARLGPKHRTAVSEIDADSWRRAREVAPAWHAESALTELEGALNGNPPRSWRLRLAAARTARYRRGALVAISGLDGSGKSTQAEGLEHALNALGYPVVRVWTSLSAHPSLARVAAPVRAVLRHRHESSGEGQQRPAAGEDSDPLTHLREGNRLLQRMWVGFVAVMNAWWVWRTVRPHLLRGRIVICDRYTLDSIVHLRYRYGSDRHYRAHLSLIRLFSPTPLRAYLLDIPPETAYARNQEYTPEQTELRAHLYREEYARLGVQRLDGERPREELCRQLALEVWTALRKERDATGPAVLRSLHAVFARLLRG